MSLSSKLSHGVASLPHPHPHPHHHHSNAHLLRSPHLYLRPQTSPKPSFRPPLPLRNTLASPRLGRRPRRSPSLPRDSVGGGCSSEQSCGDGREHDPPPIPSNGLLRCATLVGSATVASKILGLVREIVLAAVIGVGPVATAFNHAAVLPRFSTSFLGGVNGPIHITVATTLSKLPKENRKVLSEKMHAFMLLIGAVLAVLTYIYSEDLVSFSAPGLQVSPENNLMKEMCKTQLKLMTPCIFLAGSVGVGFGHLTAEGDNVIPSFSPAMTSIAIIASCILYMLMRGLDVSRFNGSLAGIFISSGASVGTILQWIIQVSLYAKPKKKANFIWWKDFFKDKDIHNLLSLLLPAILNSGLVQIASLTDLYFSSFVPGAAAGLSYAFILAMAPLGILSSIIILPVLPAFSTLAEPSMWVRLQENLEKAILLCLVITMPVTCTFCVLAGPIVSMLFQRRMFDSSASLFVASLLRCYLIGSPFWIIRELFAAVFYSLGDSKSLLLINVTAIVLNGILDWLSVTVLGAGAQGLALSTSCVTAFSVLALFLLLSKKLKGAVNVRAIGVFLPQLLASCAASGFVASLSYRTLRSFLSANTTARFCRLAEAASISLAGLLGMSSFYFSLLLADFPGMQILNGLLKTVMKRLNFVNDVWTNV
ncbi:uncharacterized protein LOC109722787 [Ananas comosus]|uniref:Uncharacterized protein LOC109722787 n=1 Tax=Ananas comosus TaxID=4615 RepID=A0A6P5GKB8_ANACO|nr:uncharacterized protein LOC109722787 [Ananas comosus]